jgi:hypothetical protein
MLVKPLRAFYSRGLQAERRVFTMCRKDDAAIQASEREPVELEPSFNSPTSKISPQSRHSTYWESSSLAISWVRLCWQAGSDIKRATKKLDGLYILADLNWRARPRASDFWRVRVGKVFFQEGLRAD